MTDERGGRYFREASFFLVGDKVAAQSHILEARSLMGYMRDMQAMGGPPVQIQRATLQDGTTIKATMMNGQFQAEIVSPPRAGVGIKYVRSLWLLFPVRSGVALPGIRIRAVSPYSLRSLTEDGGLQADPYCTYASDAKNTDGAAVLLHRFLFYKNAMFMLGPPGATLRCLCIADGYIVLATGRGPPYSFFLVPTGVLDSLVQARSATYGLQIPSFLGEAALAESATPLSIGQYYAGETTSLYPGTGFEYQDGTARFALALSGTTPLYGVMAIVAGDPALNQPGKMVKQESFVDWPVQEAGTLPLRGEGTSRNYVRLIDELTPIPGQCGDYGWSTGPYTHEGGTEILVSVAVTGRRGPNTYSYTLPITTPVGLLSATVTDVDDWQYSYTHDSSSSFSVTFIRARTYPDTTNCSTHVESSTGTFSVSGNYEIITNSGLTRTVTFNTGHTYVVEKLVDSQRVSNPTSAAAAYPYYLPDSNGKRISEMRAAKGGSYSESRTISRTTISLLVLDPANHVEAFIEYTHGLLTGQTMLITTDALELHVMKVTLVVKFHGIENRTVLSETPGNPNPVWSFETPHTGEHSSGSLYDGGAGGSKPDPFDTTRPTSTPNPPDNGRNVSWYAPAYQSEGTMAPTGAGGYTVVGNELVLYSPTFCKVYTLKEDALVVSDIGDALGVSAITPDVGFGVGMYL